MKELVVLSGKGGTGKTSVVASFAALAGGAVMADCDVDAPDLDIILRPTSSRGEDFIGGKIASINADLCRGCGRCQEACRFDAVLGPDAGGSAVAYTVNQTACEGCGACRIVCPADAIALEDTVSGEWFASTSRFGPFVHARLGVAKENSGKLVTRVRAEARRLAERDGHDLIIVDGPPGIGCPVIASLTGCGLALMVTEPTLSGLHDLRRVSELALRLSVPVAVCVNKWDINPETTREIREWADANRLPVAGTIPYDDTVTRAQIAGLAVVECEVSPAGSAVRALWQKVEAMLRG